MTPRLIRIAALSVAGMVFAAGFAWWQVDRELAAQSGRLGPSAVAAAAVGGPFALVDHTGAAVDQTSYGDALLLIYFGYGFCPDVCSTDLAGMASALDLLGEDAARVQPLFITVDPARDTADALAGYVAQFHPRLVGLTGSEAQVAEAARAYRVYYAKAGADDHAHDHAHYLMDHSSFVYLTAPGDGAVTVFPPRTAPDVMADTIKAAF